MAPLNNISMWPPPDASPTDATLAPTAPTIGLPSPLVVIYEQPIGAPLNFPAVTSVFPWIT